MWPSGTIHATTCRGREAEAHPEQTYTLHALSSRVCGRENDSAKREMMSNTRQQQRRKTRCGLLSKFFSREVFGSTRSSLGRPSSCVVRGNAGVNGVSTSCLEADAIALSFLTCRLETPTARLRGRFGSWRCESGRSLDRRQKLGGRTKETLTLRTYTHVGIYCRSASIGISACCVTLASICWPIC